MQLIELDQNKQYGYPEQHKTDILTSVSWYLEQYEHDLRLSFSYPNRKSDIIDLVEAPDGGVMVLLPLHYISYKDVLAIMLDLEEHYQVERPFEQMDGDYIVLKVTFKGE